MTRWWKCDLQISSPWSPEFSGEPGWNLDSPAGREAAANAYMARAYEVGLEVVVLAAHNSPEDAQLLVRAGALHDVIVFPGFELTTGSGADGIHVVVFGGPETTEAELGSLLTGCCGFDHDNPLFDPADPTRPMPSPRTLPQILDKLPERYLVVAPHVFGDNGLTNANSAKGSIRWKTIHHTRLGAIDVGDPGTIENQDSWRARFTRRELSDYPCLADLPFVSTSDAYSLNGLGSRYTWIRMETPTIEALRQAFLDHRARIACDWDSRYAPVDRSPNDVSHSWVQSLNLANLSTADEPLQVTLDPHLNVIIGGRGSGKSTLVSGLRLLYGDIQSLPPATREDAEQLRDTVFSQAVVSGTHLLAHSGEAQSSTWTLASGSTTVRHDSRQTPTDFRVRVVGQKELFERAASSKDNPYVTSRNLLVLVDDALAGQDIESGDRTAFDSALDEVRTAWVGAARRLDGERAAVSQLTAVEERVAELRRQVDAFDSEASRARRMQNDAAIEESRVVTQEHLGLLRDLEAIQSELRTVLAPSTGPDSVDLSPAATALLTRLGQLREEVAVVLDSAIDTARATVQGLYTESLEYRDWRASVGAAAADAELLIQELASLGLDPDAYGRIRGQLATQESVERDLKTRLAALPELETSAAGAWQAIVSLVDQRRAARTLLLHQVEDRSQILRFTIRALGDTASWVERTRQLLNLRSDGFLEDVPALAHWIWQSDEHRDRRVETWRTACITGDFSELAAQTGMRAVWASRLSDVDPLIRTRLAAELPDDEVRMDFLRDDGDPDKDEDWQPLTTGSPGQRSAAMLGFVLHYGEEPLVLDQPEDDLDTEWISELIVRQLRHSRWTRQLIVVTHNANIPVNADAERVIVLENEGGSLKVRSTVVGDLGEVEHCGPIENQFVRTDIQKIMEGGVDAFVRRERRYNNELNSYRVAMEQVSPG
jgi:energy-coupling factor transporter ATP-binding protein EcfA2